mgnify:CR=1 FL=1
MTQYIIRRALIAVPTLLLISMIIFAVLGKACDTVLLLISRPLLRWQDTMRARL